jgi:hypothetical protein
MDRTVQGILAGALVVVFLLATLARRFPHIRWLSHFRIHGAYDPERDRKLDTAWMSAEGAVPRRNPFMGILADVRKDVEAFRGAMPELPPEQKARQRRRSNIFTGLQFIMLGVALPLGFYIFKLMMFFGSVSRTERVVVFSLSGLCVVLGIIAILRSGKD